MMDFPHEGEMDPGELSRMRELLSSYYGMEEESTPVSPEDPSNIDSDAFDAESYVSDLLTSHTLQEALQRDDELLHEIRGLDSDMQMLVYENYNKFISATDTIRSMKTNVEAMEREMATLRKQIDGIGTATSDMQGRLRPNQSKVEKLVGVRRLLQKLDFLFTLPEKLSESLAEEQYSQAVAYFKMTSGVLRRYEHISSFAAIQKEAEAIIDQLREKIRGRVYDPSISASKLAELIDLFLQLGEDKARARELFLSVHKRQLLQVLAGHARSARRLHKHKRKLEEPGLDKREVDRDLEDDEVDVYGEDTESNTTEGSQSRSHRKGGSGDLCLDRGEDGDGAESAEQGQHQALRTPQGECDLSVDGLNHFLQAINEEFLDKAVAMASSYRSLFLCGPNSASKDQEAFAEVVNQLFSKYVQICKLRFECVVLSVAAEEDPGGMEHALRTQLPVSSSISEMSSDRRLPSSSTTATAAAASSLSSSPLTSLYKNDEEPPLISSSCSASASVAGPSSFTVTGDFTGVQLALRKFATDLDDASAVFGESGELPRRAVEVVESTLRYQVQSAFAFLRRSAKRHVEGAFLSLPSCWAAEQQREELEGVAGRGGLCDLDYGASSAPAWRISSGEEEERKLPPGTENSDGMLLDSRAQSSVEARFSGPVMDLPDYLASALTAEAKSTLRQLQPLLLSSSTLRDGLEGLLAEEAQSQVRFFWLWLLHGCCSFLSGVIGVPLRRAEVAGSDALSAFGQWEFLSPQIRAAAAAAAAGVSDTKDGSRLPPWMPSFALVLACTLRRLEHGGLPQVVRTLAESLPDAQQQQQLKSLQVDRVIDLQELAARTKDRSQLLAGYYVELQGRALSRVMRGALRERFTLKGVLPGAEPRQVLSYLPSLLQRLLAVAREAAAVLGEPPLRQALHSSMATRDLRRTNNSTLLAAARRGSVRVQLDVERIFARKVRVFGPVDFSLDAVVTRLLRILLKEMVEHVRGMDLARVDFQQLQVDLHFLRLVMPALVSDVAALEGLVDEVLSSAAERCDDPKPALDHADLVAITSTERARFDL